MKKTALLALGLLFVVGTAWAQRVVNLRGEDIRNIGDASAASFTLDGDTIVAWPDSVGALTNVASDVTLTGTGTVGDPLAVAAAIVSGAASGTTAYQPADPITYSWITDPPTLFDGSYLSLDDVPSEFTPEAHQHDYTAITNAPWLTEYIQSIVAAGGDATLNVATNGTEVTYTVEVTFLDWVENTDPAYLAALTNLFEGAGISITGTGRSRTISSTITQYTDSDAIAATAGVYLPIDATADAAEKLVSADGLTWLVMDNSGTGTLYWVTEGVNTNTIVKTASSVNYNGPDGPWDFYFSDNLTIEYEGSDAAYQADDLWYVVDTQKWIAESIDNDEYIFRSWESGTTENELDMPQTLASTIGNATGTITINYAPETNSVAITTADALAAAIAALNLGTMAQEDAGDYVKTNHVGNIDWTGADIRIADALHTDSPVTLKDLNDGLQAFATDILYGSTTAHPVIAGSASMVDAVPAAQTYAVLINANNTDFDAGTWYYTNKVDFVRPGKYFGRFWATRSGGSGVTARMRLVYTNVVTEAFGVIDESAAEPISDTGLRSYRISASVLESISSTGDDIYFGIGMTFRKTGGGNSTVTIYMGDPYDTHLETPGLGKPEGFVSQADLDAADQALRDEIYPAITNVITAATNVLAAVAHTGAYADLTGTPTLPGPGATDLGTGTNLVVTGATVAYYAAPTNAYTIAVDAGAPRYTYALEIMGTNAATMGTGLTLRGEWTPTGTNAVVIVPSTGTVWRVYGRAL